MLSILLPLFAYLFGSISSAVIVCWAMRLPDPRTSGSNNPGATNVLRLGGKQAALITLCGDALKGWLPVVAASALSEHAALIALVGLGAFVGHLYPLFFGFKGGKGVATAAGVLVGLSVSVAAWLVAAWLAVALLFRYSSLAALCAAGLAPLLVLWLLPETSYVVMSVAIAGLLFWRHRENIRRLATGKESKINFTRRRK